MIPLEWLSGCEIRHALSLLKPFPADLLEGYEVSTLVNSPHNDSADCISPAQGQQP
jgi:putative SOS response-associated peptidase YedK